MVQNGQGTLTIDPDDVARAEFAHSFRGYDTHEVKAFLQSVGQEMQRLRDAVAAAERRADAIAASPAAAATSAVGDEAARVLQAAEDAAAEIRTRAEEAVAKMLRDAQAEVTADRSRAQQERSDVIAAAEVDAQAKRVAAADELAKAKHEGRAMVDEAREIRERVLANLSEKRQVARRELTQLRAGIEELRAAYGNIEELLAASVGEVDRAIPSARAAAMRAGEAVSLEPEPYIAPDAPAPDRGDDDAAISTDGTGEGRVEEVGEPGPDPEGAVPEAAERTDVTETDGVHEDTEEVAPVDDSAETDSSEDPPEWVYGGSEQSEPGTVIDLESRRSAPSGPEVDLTDAPDDGQGAGDDHLDELDPELPEGDAIDERRQAERRQLFLDRPIDDGDTVLEFTPVMDEFGPADDPVPLVPARERGDIDELFARIRESRAGAVAQARAVLDRTSEIPIVTRDEPGEPLPRRSDHLVHRDEVLADLAPEVALALKRALADQLNEVLDVLRRSPEGVADAAALVPETADRRYGEVVRDPLTAAGDRGAAGASVDLGPVIRAVGTDVGTSLRNRISSFLEEPDQLERRIRALYREWRRDRVDSVAGDAVAAAFGLGLLSSLPDGTPVRWVVPDDGCCGTDCHDNSLATDVTAGEPFPTGDVMAPARPGCRGLVVPADQ